MSLSIEVPGKVVINLYDPQKMMLIPDDDSGTFTDCVVNLSQTISTYRKPIWLNQNEMRKDIQHEDEE